MRKFFCTCLLVFIKESLHAEQFLYVKHALQYVNGHAVNVQVHADTHVDVHTDARGIA